MKHLIPAIFFAILSQACSPKPTIDTKLDESMHPEYIFWGSFQRAIADQDETFILSHLQDIVDCSVCEDSESHRSKFTAQDMIKNHLRALKAPKDANYQISKEENGESTIYHVNYSIQCYGCPEGAYNLIYNLEEKEGGFRLTDIFSVP